MFSMLLLLSALFLGSILQIITQAPTDQWQKVLEKMLISAIETAIILGIMYVPSLLDAHNRSPIPLVSIPSVFLFYGLWLAFVSYECKSFLFPQLTESGLFLLHCISLLTIIPFIPQLAQSSPIVIILIAGITVLLFFNCLTRRKLSSWEKLGLSVWYLILTLLNVGIRFFPYLGTALTEVNFTISSGISFLDWVLSAGLLTHALFHFFQLTALLPSKNTRWESIRRQAVFLVDKVSDTQASITTICLQLAAILVLYTANSYLNLVSQSTLITLLFLGIPLLDRTKASTLS